MYVPLAHLWEKGGLQPGSPPQKKQYLKNTDIVHMIISKVLHNLYFSLNKPLKLADD